MRWTVAHYQPVSLFTLKHGEATSTGGKSLLVPTPFAIRTALLDVAIRLDGLGHAGQAFSQVRSLRLALRPPERVAVTNLFTKILKPEREADSDHAMQHSIAFREYVYLSGTMSLAFGGEDAELETVSRFLPQVCYFGKRGCFFQILSLPEVISTAADGTPSGFTQLQGLTSVDGRVTGFREASFALGTLQRLDDWGPELTFDRVNIYTDVRIVRGRDRVAHDVILPYRMIRSGRSFTVYERFEA